eukprot:CAMPEP_0173465102 /NCGR_PEP_ID=MMETSP1357-20121228/71082_1 /TAXON_ID=77926 /ORGANISM="Hemiselmis rufescens, Strain PCC563" /LENGTH=106 /DNA_ID=CAMNT_0014433055 /DNA_START=42 /DNA_END=359 /DNA_ORIENTATION=-
MIDTHPVGDIAVCVGRRLGHEHPDVRASALSAMDHDEFKHQDGAVEALLRLLEAETELGDPQTVTNILTALGCVSRVGDKKVLSAVTGYLQGQDYRVTRACLQVAE